MGGEPSRLGNIVLTCRNPVGTVRQILRTSRRLRTRKVTINVRRVIQDTTPQAGKISTRARGAKTPTACPALGRAPTATSPAALLNGQRSWRLGTEGSRPMTSRPRVNPVAGAAWHLAQNARTIQSSATSLATTFPGTATLAPTVKAASTRRVTTTRLPLRTSHRTHTKSSEARTDAAPGLLRKISTRVGTTTRPLAADRGASSMPSRQPGAGNEPSSRPHRRPGRRRRLGQPVRTRRAHRRRLPLRVDDANARTSPTTIDSSWTRCCSTCPPYRRGIPGQARTSRLGAGDGPAIPH
jgi:hypothetical protein